MTDKRRIIFAGTPEFAVPTLQALLASGHDVVAVYTQPDRPVGRGRKLRAGPVKQAALDAGIPVFQPESLQDAGVQRELADLQPDLLVVVAYGLLLPPEVLAIPAVACVNVHASLLPRWRGASPIQSAVLAGDAETGISIMQMDEGLDTGPVYCAEKTAIGVTESAGELHDRLAVNGAALLCNSLDVILVGKLLPVAQAPEGATYAGRISKTDGIIDWSLGAVEIDRRIRAYNPWPVAETLINSTDTNKVSVNGKGAAKQLRCWRSLLTQREGGDAAPGTVLAADADGITVQTGNGVLLLIEVQEAGRKRIAAADYANARSLPGTRLGR